MKISELSEAQFRKYFEIRLADNRMRKSGGGHIALCCFHADKTPSLSISTDKGVWKCHAGCGQGGILEFEMKFSGCDKETALAHIAEVVGESHLNLGSAPEAIYPYTDAFGKLLFQVVRYPGKRFAQRRPLDGGGWEYKTAGMKMSLYNLADVVASRNVMIVEGEKAADYVKKAMLAQPQPQTLAITTSPRGAGKWLPEFGVFMAGKQVLVVEDKDEPGRKHAQAELTSCYRWTQNIKLLQMPEDMPEHSGADDLIAKYGISNFLALTKKLPMWKPPEVESGLFMDFSDFLDKSADHIDWLVEGLIQRGANGMIIGRPKSGKSYAVIDLAIALASGQRWMDFVVPQRVNVALISREDWHGLTQWRAKKILTARNLTRQDLTGKLYVNAKGLKPKILLDSQEDVAALIADLKRYQSEFAILDVMRVLHSHDENDNTDMQKVIDILNHIQEETGTSLCLIHHDNKREDATITESVRGASAVTGWAEFIGRIRVMEETDWTREFAAEVKADINPDKLYFRISDTPENGVKLDKVDWTPPAANGRKKVKDGEAAPF